MSFDILKPFQQPGFDRIWRPTKTRKRHFCRECRQLIGKGSLCYRPDPPGGIDTHRICASCANAGTTVGNWTVVEDDNGRRPTSSDGR
jgi:hypothetical protein